MGDTCLYLWGDDTSEDHVCLLPAGHVGRHECGQSDDCEATAPNLDSAAPNPSLTRAVTDALTTLDATHRPDPWANQCLACGPEGGRWPCETHMVADDLRDALDGEGQS